MMDDRAGNTHEIHSRLNLVNGDDVGGESSSNLFVEHEVGKGFSLCNVKISSLK